MTVIKVENIGDVEDAINMLKGIKTNLTDTKIKDFVNEVSDIAKSTAEQNFSQAQYDGDNDVTVSRKLSNRGKKATIEANGEATLFIEYGTGVTYGGDAVEYPDEPIYGRGLYGKKRGSSPKGWYYKGNPGTNGEVPIKKNLADKGLIRTYGNPSNACMYNAKKEAEQRGIEILREVLNP